MTISAHDGITEITGSIIDASRLQGLLVRIAGLGAHADQPHPDRYRECSSGHVRGPIDGIEPVMTARGAAVSPLILTVGLSWRSASVPGGGIA
jgi:hypothetical protein